MNRYLITHSKRFYGPNPGHTKGGLEQLEKIILPSEVSFCVRGIGKRFQEIADIVLSKKNIPYENSPFCGGTDSIEEDGNIIHADGTIISPEKYMGLIRAAEMGFFKPWEFIASYTEGTVFCAGGELLGTLGLERIKKHGSLYKLDAKNKTGTLA